MTANGVRIERVTRPGQGVDAWRRAATDRKPFIKVGIVSGTGEHPNADKGQTLAEVGWWNEFGTRTIPERPFLRTGLNENIDKYRVILGNGLRQILLGQTDERQVLNILGMVAVSDVQAKIVSISSPPNAQLTVDRKGSSNPLIDTGALKQHITWEIVDDA